MSPPDYEIEGEPLIAPTTEVVADLTGGDEREPTAPEPEPEVEPAATETHERAPAESVTFVCDRWAGVRLHGTQIKFENHHFTTSNEGEIARLDAWEHARREG